MTGNLFNMSDFTAGVIMASFIWGSMFWWAKGMGMLRGLKGWDDDDE